MNRQALINEISALLAKQDRVLLALDGMCASGKTTFAHELAGQFGANVYHMDDFYLPWDARPANWQEMPGGNMDFARFAREVVHPLLQKEAVIYRAYSCREGRLLPAKEMAPAALEIIEGAYCMHPALERPWHMKVFVQTDESTQQARILSRNGEEGLSRFRQIWIPMEKRYFKACQVAEACDFLLDE